MTETASITVRRLDPRLKRKLRLRAAEHGLSMEEEVRAILRLALGEEHSSARNFVAAARRRFGAAGYVDLELPRRGAGRKVPSFR
jgi:plasmid stability protein